MSIKPNDKANTETGITNALNSKRPDVPDHMSLRDADWPYWYAILDSRAYDTWYTSDLCLAVQLAKCLNDLDIIQQQLEVEGYTYSNADVIRKHPAVEIQDKKIGQVGKLSRALHVHATALLGRAEDTGNRTRIQRQHQSQYGGDDNADDGLFANPDDAE